MAEVRKAKPGRGGAVGAAIEQAMGSGVRPVTPGGSPDPARPDGRTHAAAPSMSATTYLVNEAFLVPVDDSPRADAPKGAVDAPAPHDDGRGGDPAQSTR